MQFNVLFPRSLPTLSAAQAAPVVVFPPVVVVVAVHGNCAWRILLALGSFDLPRNFGGHKSLLCCSALASAESAAFNAFDFVHARQKFSFKKCALNIYACVRVFSMCVCGQLCVFKCNMFADEMNGGSLNKMLTESKLPKLSKNVEL